MIKLENISNAADGQAAEATIMVYGPIGRAWGGIEPAEVAAILRTLPDDVTIHLRVNSEGGSYFDGIAIYSTLRSDSRSVTATVDGLAASSASLVALAAERVRMQAESRMMIHLPHAFAAGDHREMTRNAELLSSAGDQLAEFYARRGSGSASEYMAMMEAETWLTPGEAKETGFADEIIDGQSVIAASAYNLSGLRNVPAEIKRAAVPGDAGADTQVAAAFHSRMELLRLNRSLDRILETR